MQTNWLRVIVWTPFLLFGAALICGALAVITFIGSRIFSAALQFAGAHPWVLVLIVLALVAWIARQASKHPSW